MSDLEIDARLKFLGIDKDVRTALKELRPLVEAELPGILDVFYAHIRGWPDVAQLFAGESQMASAKSRQLEHWLKIASGELGPEYVESARRVGLAHARLGLETRWFFGAYALVATRLLDVILTRFASRGLGRGTGTERQSRYVAAIVRVVMLDLELVNAVTFEELERVKIAETRALADSFEANVLSVVEGVAAAANQMARTAQSMAATAESTSERSAAVAAAAEEATTNVSVVATSADEMGRSVEEIARQVGRSTLVATQAVERADATNETMERLSASAEKIGAVVSLISDIAEQTNLLALNATIESARAGEAGKGFAVVAAEVKSLATQTAKATEDIARQIQEMQSITQSSVEALGAIRATIGEIDTVSASINAAVEQQAAAAREIARSTQEAAAGAQDVSSNISGVLTTAQETGAASGEVVEASDELGRQAERLGQEVERYLASVRAA